MRTLLIIIQCFLLLGSISSKAQTFNKSYYIEPYNATDLEPKNRTKSNEFLKLKFKDNSLTSLFDRLDIVTFKKAFPGIKNTRLKKVYLIEVQDSIQIEKFKNSLIKDIELAPVGELTTSIPNDYYIPTFDNPNPGDTIRNNYLDLIQAPCAWDITQGSSSILVGVADSYFTFSHEELNNKIVAILGEGSPSSYLWQTHGTAVASLIAAETDNNKGTASIGYETRLVGYTYGTSISDVWDLATTKIYDSSSGDSLRVKVINMSWVSPYSSIDKEILNTIRDSLNVVLIAAGGNKKQCGNPGNDNHFNYLCYPASYESVISVTAVGSRYPRNSQVDSLLQDVLTWNDEEWQGRHLNHMNLNDSIDIAAPGYNNYRATNTGGLIGSTDTYSKYGRGTSSAAPIVSGAAALMLAVNPNLTPIEVKNILKITADRIDTIAQNQEYFGQGPDKLHIQLGRLNSYKAVKMAQYFPQYGYSWDRIPKDVDLMVRDTRNDEGIEPNPTTERLWESKDIWIRNYPDGIEQHQNPEYNNNGKSYVYVRITNKGCDPSSGNDELQLHWAKAGTSLAWDYSWIGNYFFNGGPLLGNTIATVNIPVIEPGEETIIEIPWLIPDPQDYQDLNGMDNPWHFCLLARVISEDDPIIPLSSGSSSLNDYVRNNNNVAWKNITVVNLHPNTIGSPIGGVIAVGNPLDVPKTFDLQFSVNERETGKKIFDEAEVSIILNDILIEAWEQGGEQSINLIREDNTFMVTGDNAELKNLTFTPKEMGTLGLQFNFLTEEITTKESYTYYVIQKVTSTGEIFGGETYKINKDPRPLFYAHTNGNKLVDKGEFGTFNAQLIGEPAVYNWYDNENNLIYEGVNFNTPVSNEKYKLEVIALSDGYKDYKQVEFKYKPNRITTIYSNPTIGQVTIGYKINQGNTAYLAITTMNGNNSSNNYILDIKEDEISLDISNLAPNIYVLTLFTDGKVCDSKNLIKI